MRGLVGVFAVVASLVACGEAEEGGDPGPGPGGNMPAYCAEDRREGVADPAVAADGFAFAAGDATPAHEGSFVGELVSYSEESDAPPAVALTLTLHVESVEAVYTVFVDPNDGSDTGPAMGAPEFDDGGGDGCAPYYELHLSGTITTADGALAESITATSRVGAADQGAFSAVIDLGDVQGTIRPRELDVAAWDAVQLSFDAQRAGDGWTGQAQWWGIDDTSDDEGSFTYDTATGVGTGTVSPSGMSEAVGSFAAARP